MVYTQRKQTLQKAETGKRNAAGIPMQAKLPPARGGAPVRVRYQPSPALQTGGAVQCFGLGKMLKKLFCCCMREPHMDHGDGPCAVTAMKGLGWEPDYRDRGIMIQSQEFGAKGTVVNNDAAFQALTALQPVMLLFFRPTNPVPFHVMYIENGDLCGKNNDWAMLHDKLGMDLEAAADRHDHELEQRDEQALDGLIRVAVNTLHFNGAVPPTVKYVTRNDYLVFRRNHGLQPADGGIREEAENGILPEP